MQLRNKVTELMHPWYVFINLRRVPLMSHTSHWSIDEGKVALVGIEASEAYVAIDCQKLLPKNSWVVQAAHVAEDGLKGVAE